MAIVNRFLYILPVSITHHADLVCLPNDILRGFYAAAIEVLVSEAFQHL